MRNPNLRIPEDFMIYAAGQPSALHPSRLAGLGEGADYSALAQYNYVAPDGSIVITDPYTSGFEVGTTIRADGTIIFPDGSVYGADGSYYPPNSASVQDAGGSTFNYNELLPLLTAGVQLARVWVTGSPTYTPGVPLPSPATYPYATQVRSPSGQTTTFPANSTIPAGYTVLGTASSGMGTTTLLLIGGLAIIAMMVVGAGKKS